MIEITSRSSVLRRGELRRCIALLGQEYTSLPYRIYVYRDLEEVQIERDSSPDMPIEEYNYILNNVVYQPPGVCVHEKKLIKLFPFNLDTSNSAMQKLHSVGNAFHELRHAWQYVNGLYHDEGEQRLESNHIEDYLTMPSERDAYAFQEEQMNKNVDKISEILGCPRYNYTCDVEALKRKIRKVK